MTGPTLSLLPKSAAVALAGTLLLGGLTGATIPTGMKAPFGPDWRRDYGVRFDPSRGSVSFVASQEAVARDIARPATAHGMINANVAREGMPVLDAGKDQIESRDGVSSFQDIDDAARMTQGNAANRIDQPPAPLI